MTLYEAKKQIVELFRMMYHMGMVNLFEGNISMRWEDHYLITPSQKNKETMTPEMVLEVGEDDHPLRSETAGTPSTEFKMHREIYRLRPDINAVVHEHSCFATAFAVAGKPIDAKGLAEANVVFGQIPVAAYGRPGTDDIHKDFSVLFAEYNAVLLENHGIVTAGPDLTTAFALAEAAEKTAKILMLAGLLGGEKTLPESEIQLLRDYGSSLRHKTMNQ